MERGPREEHLDKNLKPRFKSRRPSVGDWSGYCRDEIGPLVILEEGGRMTAKRYLETIKSISFLSTNEWLGNMVQMW